MNNKTNALLPIAGADLTVSVPVGVTVTVSKDGKSKPPKVATNGIVTFRNLEEGEWTITISDGTDVVSKKIQIKTNYSLDIRPEIILYIYYDYSRVTSCTLQNGTTIINSPDTGGYWECTVHQLGIWTLTIDYIRIDAEGKEIKESTTVSISAIGNGQAIVVVSLPPTASKTLYMVNKFVEDSLGPLTYIPASFVSINKSEEQFIVTNNDDKTKLCILTEKTLDWSDQIDHIFATTQIFSASAKDDKYGYVIIVPEAAYTSIDAIEQAIIFKSQKLTLSDLSSGVSSITIEGEEISESMPTGAKIGILLDPGSKMNLKYWGIDYYGGISIWD